MTEKEFEQLKANQSAAAWAATPDTSHEKFISIGDLVRHPRQPRTGYRSKVEERYAAHLDLMVKAEEIQGWMYEPITLKLAPGVRYTPDFLVRKFDGTFAGTMVFQELKGRKGDTFWTMPVSRVKIRLAATLFPWWRMEIVWPDKLGTWCLMTVPSGKPEAK